MPMMERIFELKGHKKMVTISNEDYKELCRFVSHVNEKVQKGEKVSKLWAEVSAKRIWKMMDKVAKRN